MTLAATAACSGASSPSYAGLSSSAHAAFVARVNAVCSAAVARHSGHQFPVLGFDPEHPSTKELPIVGAYFARYGGLPTTTAALHALTPPRDETRVWAALLALADRMTTNAQRQIAAARASDVTAFVATVHVANDLSDKLNAAGSRLGFSAGASCHQVFG